MQRRKVHRSTFLTSGALADVLGINRDEIDSILERIGVLKNGRVTRKGLTVSRTRTIYGNDFVLWGAHALSRIMRKALEEIPDETQPVFVEPELEQVASMSTLELDLLPTPELDVEALAA